MRTNVYHLNEQNHSRKRIIATSREQSTWNTESSPSLSIRRTNLPMVSQFSFLLFLIKIFYFYFLAALVFMLLEWAFSSFGGRGFLLLWSMGSRHAGSISWQRRRLHSHSMWDLPDHAIGLSVPMYWQVDS